MLPLDSLAARSVGMTLADFVYLQNGPRSGRARSARRRARVRGSRRRSVRRHG